MSKILLKIVAVLACALFCFSCSTHHKTKRGDYYSNRHRHVEQTVDLGYSKHLKGHEKMVVEEALEWIGTPYLYAHQEKGAGTDCSGMVMVVYDKTIGCQLPRNSASQSEHCKEIKQKHVQPGDLVFFATGSDRNQVSHVGIMIDELNFIHASSSKGVMISNMNSSYFAERLVMFGRVPCFKH